MADFDATQAIELSDYDDMTDDEVGEEDKKPVARLKVLCHKGFPETLFPIYDGNNVVGRQEGACNVLIPLKALSKQHACIEIRGEQHFLVDKGSRNKTRRGKMFLLPEAKYELQHGDQVTFADIGCVYLREDTGNASKARDDAIDKEQDSGSETGSESLLEPDEGGPQVTIVKEKLAVVEETFIYEEASDPSSDLLQPTQAFLPDASGLPVESTSTSVPDSDPETDTTKTVQDLAESTVVAETPAVQRTKGVCDDEKTGEGKKVTMALTEAFTYYEDDEEEEDEVERARIACEPTQVCDSGGETDEGDGLDEYRRSSIFEAATQACVDCEAETQAVVDVGDAGDNAKNKVFADDAPDSMTGENEVSQMIFPSGDPGLGDGDPADSDSTSSCGSPVFPSSIGMSQEGDVDYVAVTTNHRIGASPALRGERKIVHSEFARPFPVVGKTPTGSALKSSRRRGESPSQLPSTDVAVTTCGGVVESPEGSTGFEPEIHSTQIGGKESHDESFPSLRLDASQQDEPLPSAEGSLHINSDDVCTQAYGHEEDATNYPNKGQGISTNSDDICTQAYGDVEGTTNYPNKGQGISTNSDDVCTQAYGDEDCATNYPNKGQGISTNSDDVCTQAYGNEEGTTIYPNKGQGIVANSDDVCTQAYGDEEGATNYPNIGEGIATNSDDVCTQAYTREQSTVLRSSPRKRQGRKMAVPSARDSPDITGSGQSQIVESSQPLEDEEDDVLMPLAFGKLRGRASPGRTGKDTCRLVRNTIQADNLAEAPGRRGRVPRRTQSQVPVEIAAVATRRRHSDLLSATTTAGDDVSKPRKAARLTLGETVIGPAVRVADESTADEGTGGKTQRRRSAVRTDVEALAEKVKNAKVAAIEQKETTATAASSRNSIAKNGSVSAVASQSETTDRGQAESEVRSTRTRRSVVKKTTGAVMETESKDGSDECIEERLSATVAESESRSRSTRNRKSVNEETLPSTRERKTTSNGKQKTKELVTEKRNESAPLSRTSKRMTEKKTIAAAHSTEQRLSLVEVIDNKPRSSRGRRSVVEKPVVAEKQAKDTRRTAGGRKSVASEVTEPKKLQTISERESPVSADVDRKTPKNRSSRTAVGSQSESDTRSTRRRKTVDVKPPTPAKQKDCETMPAGGTKEVVVDDSESKTRSKRKPSGRANTRRSALIVTDENKSSGVGAPSNLAPSPKQKDNVGRPPKRRQSQASSASEVDSSQPCKRSKGRQVPAVPPSPLSLRERQQSSRPRVMFTGMFDSHGEQILKSLGGQVVDNVYDCTHLVTDRVRRTVKFLCGVGRGIPIVGPEWLVSCREANKFTDVDRFLVHDEESETKFGFDLATSLQKASSNRLLDGYRVHVTSNVKPEPKQMKDIIQCAGGEYLTAPPRTNQENTIVVSCDADKAICQRTLDENIPVVNAEFLLAGILRQEVEIDVHRLAPSASTTKIERSSRKKR